MCFTCRGGSRGVGCLTQLRKGVCPLKKTLTCEGGGEGGGGAGELDLMNVSRILALGGSICCVLRGSEVWGGSICRVLPGSEALGGSFVCVLRVGEALGGHNV